MENAYQTSNMGVTK